VEKSAGPALRITDALELPAAYPAKIPAEVRLIDVVAPFDDLGRERQCLLVRGSCSDVGGCPVQREWREASAPAFRFFATRKRADLMHAAHR
jgi:DNA-binding IscR family transcriptional regulator